MRIDPAARHTRVGPAGALQRVLAALSARNVLNALTVLALLAVPVGCMLVALPADAAEAGSTQPADAPGDVTAAAADLAEADSETDELLPFRLSLPTEADSAAWQQPGFRMQLGVGFGRLAGLFGTPGAYQVPILIRIGARLDRDWSLFGSFQFAVAGWRSTGDLSGMRFAGTIDPTWHVTEHLDLAAGFGFGGLVEGATGRREPDAEQRTTLVASWTFPSARTPMISCSGVGVAGNLRASYLWVLGPLSATGFAAQLDGQWTACVETVGRVEPDTARPITRRQWWSNAGGSLSWVISWR